MKAEIWTDGENWFVFLNDAVVTIEDSDDDCVRYCQESDLLYTIYYQPVAI